MLLTAFIFYVFFFSSRRRHTRYIGDWSSDVCSSDLVADTTAERNSARGEHHRYRFARSQRDHRRSEERRVGKECRSRWWPYHEKKKTRKSRRRKEERTSQGRNKCRDSRVEHSGV